MLTIFSDSTRMLFATWWIFITILTSFYTANLTAFLTLSRFTLPINSREDILNNNHRFVAYRGSGVEYSIKNVICRALSKLNILFYNITITFLVLYIQDQRNARIPDAHGEPESGGLC